MKFGTFGAAMVKEFAPSGPVPFFEDGWDTGNAFNWDNEKWPAQRTGSLIITGGKGQISTGPRPLAFSYRNVVDFDMVVQVQYSTLSGQYLELGWRVGRYMYSGTPDSGYVLQIGEGSTAKIFRINSYTQVGSTVSTPELTGAVTAWFRIRSVGSAHKVRWWLDGASEPSSWNIEVTDATYTEGALMLGNYGSGVINFDNLDVVQVSSEDTAVGSLKVTATGSNGGMAKIDPSGFTGTTLTMCGWFQFSVSGGNPMMGFSDGGATYWIIGTGSGGTLQLSMPSNTIATAHTPTLNAWYFLAATRDASGSELYWAPEGGSLTVQTSGGAPAITAGMFHMLADTYAVYGRGCIGDAKVWLAKLTQSELEDEMESHQPVRTANLFGNWSFTDGIRRTDESGNGKTLTFEGGLVAGPATPAAA